MQTKAPTPACHATDDWLLPVDGGPPAELYSSTQIRCDTAVLVLSVVVALWSSSVVTSGCWAECATPETMVLRNFNPHAKKRCLKAQASRQNNCIDLRWKYDTIQCLYCQWWWRCCRVSLYHPSAEWSVQTLKLWFHENSSLLAKNSVSKPKTHGKNGVSGWNHRGGVT